MFLVPFAMAAAMSHAAPAAELPAPTVWQPGVISTPMHDAAPAFSPDGRTVVFSRSIGKGLPLPAIFISHLKGGRWSPPELAPFSGRFSDLEPYFAPDGSYLVFISNRPIAAGGKLLDGHYNKSDQPGNGGNIWRVDRKGDGWGEPTRLPDAVNSSTSTFAPALAGDGSIYFMQPNAETGRFQLFRSQFAGGAYQAAQALPFSDGTVTTVDPAVRPDESFIVFGGGWPPARQLDMFVVFKRPDGAWGRPVHLGDKVGAPGSDAEARLSPDGKTLYFSSERPDPSQPKDPDGWNNGKYNIWSVRLDPAAWRALKARSIGPA